MPRRELSITKDADALERMVRVLGASANVAILRELVAARKEQKSGGWVFLSDLASRVGEAPGTVSVAIQRLIPTLVEDKYEGRRRYYRARVTSLKLELEEVA